MNALCALAATPPAQDPLAPEPHPQARILYPYGVGIDTHSKFIQVCVLYQDDATVRQAEKEFPTTWSAILEARQWVLSVLGSLATAETLRYCIESTGTYHMPVLKAWGAVPSVVNPLLAGPTRRKTDVLDARLLAHYSITGVWKPSFIPPEEAQVLRVLWAARREGLRAASRASNRINNIVLRFGHTFGREASMRQTRSEGILDDLINGRTPKVQDVAPDGLPENIRTIIRRLMSDLEAAKEDVRRAVVETTNYVKSRDWPTGTTPIPGTNLLALLQTVPGVGVTTAVTWLAEVGDPKRFQLPKQVSAYSGCDPSLKISAGKVTSHVRRAGNARLHQALLYAASGVLRRPNDRLAQWGQSIAGRHKKGGYRKACGAIARRIAVGLWYVHIKQEPFSYDGYRFGDYPEVANVPLADIVRAQAVKLLRKDGIRTSQELADAYFRGKLAAIHGLGELTIKTVQTWVQANKKRTNQHNAPDQPSTAGSTPANKTYVLDSSRIYTPGTSTAAGNGGKPKTARNRTKTKR